MDRMEPNEFNLPQDSTDEDDLLRNRINQFLKRTKTKQNHLADRLAIKHSRLNAFLKGKNHAMRKPIMDHLRRTMDALENDNVVGINGNRDPLSLVLPIPPSLPSRGGTRSAPQSEDTVQRNAEQVLAQNRLKYARLLGKPDHYAESLKSLEPHELFCLLTDFIITAKKPAKL